LDATNSASECALRAEGETRHSQTPPLFKTISQFLNEDMLASLAKAYEEGRLLLIGSTDLDASKRSMR